MKSGWPIFGPADMRLRSRRWSQPASRRRAMLRSNARWGWLITPPAGSTWPSPPTPTPSPSTAVNPTTISSAALPILIRTSSKKPWLISNHAVQEAPYNDAAYWGRGKIHLALNDPNWAIVQFSHAIELDPHNPTYYEDRARAYERLGQIANAAADREFAGRLLQGWI